MALAGGRVSVWAHSIGQWKEGGGYDHVVSTASFADLIDQLEQLDRNRKEKRRLRGKIWKLVILSHGDAPGIVKFPAGGTSSADTLSVETLGQYKKHIERLRYFLRPNGMLGFYGCISGAGNKGDAFLIAVAKLLGRKRTVVGFNTLVWFSRFKSVAGQLKDMGVSSRVAADAREKSFKNKPNIRVTSQNAKWARGNEIIREPKVDVKANALKRITRSAKENKKLWEARCDTGERISLIRKAEKKGLYYHWPSGWNADCD